MSLPTSTPPRRESPRGLLDQLLHEQQLLTPVAEFARKHDRGEWSGTTARHRELLPVTPLVAGEQYAFEVQLDKCSGCKACVTACHSLNGLDEDETWRDVGLLISAPSKPWQNVPAIQQTVTTACHHCVDPACLNGCPVLAYEKDSVTGIVRHLDDQCIGCQYCVLKCPYDVPKYNSRLGIVRKCDMCASRLAVGEAPACAQACPNEAIRITKVSKSEVTIQFRERSENFLNGAPAGDYTLPTTRYVNGSAAASGQSATTTTRLMAADSSDVRPQPAHWPLVLMLVLSQASVGVVILAVIGRSTTMPLLALSLALGGAGLGASVFHLGRPLGAWRAFLNLKRSWMSREIVVFGLYFGLLATTAAVIFANQAAQFRSPSPLTASTVWTIPAAVFGLLGVFCSAMIYHDTRRPLWHWRRSMLLFFGSTVALGAAGVAILHSSGALLAVVIIAVSIKLTAEILTLGHGTDRTLAPLKKTAMLISGRFQHVAFARILCALTGGVGLPILLMVNTSGSFHTVAAVFMFALLLVGELIERFLFFTTVVAPKMPGGLPA